VYCRIKKTKHNKAYNNKDENNRQLFSIIMKFTAVNVPQEALQEDQHMPCYPQLIALKPAEQIFRYVE